MTTIQQPEALRLALEALLDIPLESRNPMQKEAIIAIKEALAQPEQEPVGTLNISRFKGHLVNHDFDYFGELSDGTYSLYTSPPKRQPLTDEEIWQLVNDCVIGGDLHAIKYGRAIEAAHGIKEKT